MQKPLDVFLGDRRGNVAIIFGLTAPVLVFAVGMATDFAMATRARTRLNAIADAAALQMVSSRGMAQTDDAAKADAQQLFMAEAAQLANVSLPNGPTINITHPSSAASRTAQISYNATYSNIFAGVLGVSTLDVSGAATAQSAVAPNADYYVLVDNSSSMTLPATKDGISLMQTLTKNTVWPTGCAFACHIANPNWKLSWSVTAAMAGFPCVAGSSDSNCRRMDPYALARANNITLRIDEVVRAVDALVAKSEALKSQFSVPPTYRLKIDTLDTETTANMATPMPLTEDYANQWPSAKPNLVAAKQWDFYGSWGCAPLGSDPCGTGIQYQVGRTYYPEAGYDDTNLPAALQAMAAKIPQAGSGASGSAPAEILFLVTDGVEDYVTTTREYT